MKSPKRKNNQIKNKPIVEAVTKPAGEKFHRFYNWEEHPVKVAAYTAAGVATFAIVLFTQVLLPEQTASLTNQITELTAQVKSLKKEVVSLQEAKNSAKKLNNQLQSNLNIAQHANLFAVGNPYPVGLGLVRINDPISRLADVYPERNIFKQDEESSLVIVKDYHKVFNSIYYSYDDKKPGKPISSITFSLYQRFRMPEFKSNLPVEVNWFQMLGIIYSRIVGTKDDSPLVIPPTLNIPNEYDDDFLQGKLVESLGTPTKLKRKGYFSWDTKSKVNVFKYESMSFLLVKEGYMPGIWPDE